MEFLELFAFLGIGLFSGFWSGMFGIGGGSIKIPLLTLMGMPLINAFATNMLAIPFSAITGAVVQRKNIDWRVARFFTTGGVLGIIVATFFANVFPSYVLALIFVTAAMFTIFGLYLDEFNHKLYESISPTRRNLFLFPFFGNLIIGLRGGSGGTLFPPLLRMLHVGMHRAVATSLFTSIFAAIFALVIYFFNGVILIVPGLIVGAGALVGSFIGSKVSLNTKPMWLKLGLSCMVVIFAFIVFYKEFF